MACQQKKIDSNSTGLRFAEEECIGALPTSGVVWFPLEPNSYNDFGGQITTVSRNPINQTRQRKKGVVTDLDASGGFNQDLTQTNTLRILQGFFFADTREKATTAPMNGAAIAITAIDTGADTYAAAAGLDAFLPGALVMASGFADAANNGIKTIVSTAAGLITVAENLVSDASPAATGALQTIGFQFEAGEVEITATGLPRLVRTTGAFDFTTLGLIPGEWLFLGGDAVGDTFVNNQGFARISSIAATYLEFDKTTWTPVVEAAGALTVQVFFGSVLRNEDDPMLIKRRSYHLERTLGHDLVGTQSELLIGSVANELTVNIPQADKVNIDLGFVATDHQARSGTDGLLAGTRVEIDETDAINTSSDFSRIKMAIVSDVNAAPVPLFAYATELTLTINNNVTPNKAVGILGAFETTAGTFEAGGSATVYFADVAAVQAVRNNADVTFDVIMAKRNAGMVWDVPLLSLGDGRLAVEQDQPITLPLEMMGAQSVFGHSMLFQSFPYLPTVAE